MDEVIVDRLALNLPSDKICSSFNVEPADLSVSVIARDQAQRHYKVIFECQLDEVDETPDLLDRLPTNLALGKLSISVYSRANRMTQTSRHLISLPRKSSSLQAQTRKLISPLSGKLRKSLKQRGCQGLHFGIFLGLEKT